jgi:hypothetical protein
MRLRLFLNASCMSNDGYHLLLKSTCVCVGFMGKFSYLEAHDRNQLAEHIDGFVYLESKKSFVVGM